jgi:hypothetical protein
LPEGTSPLGPWHDFYVVLGTASGGLIGAMFVVVSIGSGFLTKERATDVRIFLTPTMANLATILLSCVVALVPSLERISFSLLFGIGSLGGLAYATAIARHVTKREIEHVDHFWYAIVPPIGYVAITVAALLMAFGERWSLELLATGIAIILVAGLRNAWDMILFLIQQARGPG